MKQGKKYQVKFAESYDLQIKPQRCPTTSDIKVRKRDDKLTPRNRLKEMDAAA